LVRYSDGGLNVKKLCLLANLASTITSNGFVISEKKLCFKFPPYIAVKRNKIWTGFKRMEPDL